MVFIKKDKILICKEINNMLENYQAWVKRIKIQKKNKISNLKKIK
jgi:hypothetical protein